MLAREAELRRNACFRANKPAKAIDIGALAALRGEKVMSIG
jgi:hypothetical protein